MVVKVVINVPEINYAYRTSSIDYADPNTKQDNIDMLNSIKSNYQYAIQANAMRFEIPAGFIASFIATESSGRNVAANRFKATGLMQITPAAFYETFTKRLSTASISQQEKDLVQRFLPAMLNSSLSLPVDDISKALMQPEFNIYAGSLYLDFLIDRFSINGKAQINKVLVGYNAGAYNRVISSNIAIAIDSNHLVKNILVPEESRGYLVKMLGVDGFLDIIYRQGLVTF